MTERYPFGPGASASMRTASRALPPNSIRNRFISTKEPPPTRLPGFGKRIAEHGLDEVERRLGYYIGAGNQQKTS
jgi:hypothetical protein